MTGNNRSSKKYLNYFFAVLVLLLGW
ncbi:MAG: hypothetical protein PWP44_1077, partial [Thermacetogenium sp.]|nr:hypothetical protein [Thermacetogenium sp.]